MGHTLLIQTSTTIHHHTLILEVNQVDKSEGPHILIGDGPGQSLCLNAGPSKHWISVDLLLFPIKYGVPSRSMIDKTRNILYTKDQRT